jgi:hypothetical protein
MASLRIVFRRWRLYGEKRKAAAMKEHEIEHRREVALKK